MKHFILPLVILLAFFSISAISFQKSFAQDDRPTTCPCTRAIYAESTLVPFTKVPYNLVNIPYDLFTQGFETRSTTCLDDHKIRQFEKNCDKVTWDQSCTDKNIMTQAHFFNIDGNEVNYSQSTISDQWPVECGTYMGGPGTGGMSYLRPHYWFENYPYQSTSSMSCSQTKYNPGGYLLGHTIASYDSSGSYWWQTQLPSETWGYTTGIERASSGLKLDGILDNESQDFIGKIQTDWDGYFYIPTTGYYEFSQMVDWDCQRESYSDTRIALCGNWGTKLGCGFTVQSESGGLECPPNDTDSWVEVGYKNDPVSGYYIPDANKTRVIEIVNTNNPDFVASSTRFFGNFVAGWYPVKLHYNNGVGGICTDEVTVCVGGSHKTWNCSGLPKYQGKCKGPSGCGGGSFPVPCDGDGYADCGGDGGCDPDQQEKNCVETTRILCENATHFYKFIWRTGPNYTDVWQEYPSLGFVPCSPTAVPASKTITGSAFAPTDVVSCSGGATIDGGGSTLTADDDTSPTPVQVGSGGFGVGTLQPHQYAISGLDENSRVKTIYVYKQGNLVGYNLSCAKSLTPGWTCNVTDSTQSMITCTPVDFLPNNTNVSSLQLDLGFTPIQAYSWFSTVDGDIYGHQLVGVMPGSPLDDFTPFFINRETSSPLSIGGYSLTDETVIETHITEPDPVGSQAYAQGLTLSGRTTFEDEWLTNYSFNAPSNSSVVSLGSLPTPSGSTVALSSKTVYKGTLSEFNSKVYPTGVSKYTINDGASPCSGSCMAIIYITDDSGTLTFNHLFTAATEDMKLLIVTKIPVLISKTLGIDLAANPTLLTVTYDGRSLPSQGILDVGILSKGDITFESNNPTADNPVLVDGMVVSQNAVNLERDLGSVNNTKYPSEVIRHFQKYIYLIRYMEDTNPGISNFTGLTDTDVRWVYGY